MLLIKDHRAWHKNENENEQRRGRFQTFIYICQVFSHQVLLRFGTSESLGKKQIRQVRIGEEEEVH